MWALYIAIGMIIGIGITIGYFARNTFPRIPFTSIKMITYNENNDLYDVYHKKGKDHVIVLNHSDVKWYWEISYSNPNLTNIESYIMHMHKKKLTEIIF